MELLHLNWKETKKVESNYEYYLNLWRLNLDDNFQ